MEQEAELHRLREENEELKKRVSDLSAVDNAKKKLEVKVEHLEQKASLRQCLRALDWLRPQMDTMIHEKVSQKANELTATYDEKLRNYEDRYLLLLSIEKNE